MFGAFNIFTTQKKNNCIIKAPNTPSIHKLQAKNESTYLKLWPMKVVNVIRTKIGNLNTIKYYYSSLSTKHGHFYKPVVADSYMCRTPTPLNTAPMHVRYVMLHVYVSWIRIKKLFFLYSDTSWTQNGRSGWGVGGLSK